MSAIYLHTEADDPVRISGAERGWLGGIVDAASLASVQLDQGRLRRLWKEKDPDLLWVMRATRGDPHRISYNVGGETVWDAGGGEHNAFHVALNSAMAFGGPHVRLAARLHGQCEIHCYVEDVQRHFLARKIEDATSCGIFRAGVGWEEAVARLREVRHFGAAVFSYSTTRNFPCLQPGAIDPVYDDEREWDAACREFDALPRRTRWGRAMEALRQRNRDGCRMHLADFGWERFTFGDAPTLPELRRQYGKERPWETRYDDWPEADREKPEWLKPPW